MTEAPTKKPRYSVPRSWSSPQLWKYNDYRVEGDVAILILRNRAGETLEVKFDAVELPVVLKAAHWGIQKYDSGLVYARGIPRGDWSPVIGQRKPNLFLHRFLMQAPKGMVVDHINGDGLDCRRMNLRIVTYAENAKNQTHHRRIPVLVTALEKLINCRHRSAACLCRIEASKLVDK